MINILTQKTNQQILSALLIFVCFTACAPKAKVALRPNSTQLNEIKNIAVVVPYANEFTVLSDITNPTMIFVGSTKIPTNEQEKQIASRLSSKLEEFSCYKTLIESLKNTLADSGTFVRIHCASYGILQNQMKNYDAVVTFYINKWGIRSVESDDNYLNMMAPFIEIEALMETTSTKQLFWDEVDTVFGKNRRHLADYEGNNDLLKNDLIKTVENTGRIMAYTLIYY